MVRTGVQRCGMGRIVRRRCITPKSSRCKGAPPLLDVKVYRPHVRCRPVNPQGIGFLFTFFMSSFHPGQAFFLRASSSHSNANPPELPRLLVFFLSGISFVVSDLCWMWMSAFLRRKNVMYLRAACMWWVVA